MEITGSRYGIYLENCTGSAGQEISLVNNSIYVGASGRDGIRIRTSQYLQLYHNSVYINNDRRACYITDSGNLTLYNNILSNSDNDSGARALSIDSDTAAPPLHLTTTSTTATVVMKSPGADYMIIYRDLVAATGGQEANSHIIDPQFAAPDNLVPTELIFDDTGLPLPSVTQDINGVPRPGNPDPGAYEFGIMVCALSGTYSIPGDYPSVPAAWEAASLCGISGPVVFEIATGTYNERLVISGIAPGASSINTITFTSQTSNPADVSFTYANTTAGSGNYIVNLSGTQHLTFSNMTFENTSADYGRVVVLDSTVVSSNITFTGNEIRGNATTETSSIRALIYAYPAAYQQILITNNILENGSHGIYMQGNTGDPHAGSKYHWQYPRQPVCTWVFMSDTRTIYRCKTTN